MSSKPKVARVQTPPGQNPVINKQGTASFPAGQFATWNTVNGQTSTVTISNPGQNTLTVLISGAPSTITTSAPVAGDPLNGLWTIDPNCPTCQVIAAGDFDGQTVTLVNNSNPSTTCSVDAVVD